MAARLRIGMIGCGEIAVQTARGIAASTLGQHVMVMDTDAHVAGDLGATYGVPHTTKVEDLLANPQVDAVYIAVPHFLHAPLAIQAAQAGSFSRTYGSRYSCNDVARKSSSDAPRAAYWRSRLCMLIWMLR